MSVRHVHSVSPTTAVLSVRLHVSVSVRCLHSAGQATMALLVTYHLHTSQILACQTTALVRRFVAIPVRLTCLSGQTSKATGWGAG